ncbi:alpha-mannosidase [Anaeramoeba flamelloides]|uniref:Alpha-mannosidase n=1 Tax=Anaeramoeba flamelloides TaxID=1746091 RepID=A0ABQ8X8Q5_9EUKA|nr:alpha-mannosidase [Anaeramoeba flamelloides]
MKSFLIFFSFCLFLIPFSKVVTETTETPVTVHILPHSHCDVGWQDTPEGYYTTRVKHILDSVVEQCSANPEYRFIWVEVWFLQQWWADSTELQREQFKALVEKKQIELVLGGIVMSDDANVYFEDDIDQLTEGHTWLKENVVPDHPELLPKHAWHIDPFGESSWNPTVFNDICFDVFVINRISQSLKNLYMADQDLEFIWRGLESKSASSGREHNPWVLGHVLPHHYSAPPGFNWEDDPKTNPAITAENIDDRATVLCTWLKGVAATFQDNILLQTFGDDFKFQHASWQYGNMSLLIDYINSNPEKFNMIIQFSTLREYFDDLYSRELEFPVTTQNFDFFPYDSTVNNDYWTGYFTSWPIVKRLVRYTSNILRTADFFWSLSGFQFFNEIYTKTFENILWLRREMGVAQHHDTITGTSPQINLRRVQEQLLHGQSLVKDSLNNILIMMQEASGISYQFNIDLLVKEIETHQEAAVVVMNNLAWKREEWIKISLENYTLLLFEMKDIKVKYFGGLELNPSHYTFINKELFIYSYLPPLGYQCYSIVSSTTDDEKQNENKNGNENENENGNGNRNRNRNEIQNGNGNRNKNGNRNENLNDEGLEIETENVVKSAKEIEIEIGDLDKISKMNLPNIQGNLFTMENEYYQITFDLSTGKPIQLKNIEIEREIPFEYDWYQYIGSLEDNNYILNVEKNATKLAEKVTTFKYYTSDSHLVQEVRITIDYNIKQTIRLYERIPEVEIEIDVGSILPPQELISRFNVGLETNGYFYTDSFGFQLFEKYKWTKWDSISSSYRPMTSYAALRDEKNDLQMTFIHDFARGAASLDSGSIEFMHVRADFGNGWLLDGTTTNQKIWITFDSIEKQEQSRAKSNIIHQRAPLLMYSAGYNARMNCPRFNGLKEPFPDHTHLVSLKRISKDNPKSIIRLMNVITPETANSDVNQPVDINLFHYFKDYLKFDESTEITLTGLWDKNSCQRKDWKWSNKPEPHSSEDKNQQYNVKYPFNKDIELLPGEIRTFEIETQY